MKPIQILVGITQQKGSCGRYRRKSHDNIKTELREIRCEVVHCMELVHKKAQLQASVTSPQNSIIFNLLSDYLLLNKHYSFM